MRLIDTETLELQEFVGIVPGYAILSHTWVEGQEVSYKEFRKPSATIKAKSGYRKIVAAAKLAREETHRWIWIDTCCIDKSSSAELSEAINSMFKWYEESLICFAYLSDVQAGDEASFRKSKWHTRGWTLQELLAPRHVFFFDRSWIRLFDKHDSIGLLSSITGISKEAIRDGDMWSYPVAERMSWASRRETTRSEDLAYCLLGIFDIAMPMLYGEGARKAFVRLQEHIMQKSDDQTIFIWSSRMDGGMLAWDPKDFSVYRGWRSDVANRISHVYSMTNKGLSGVFFVCDAGGRASDRTVLLMLECANAQEQLPVVILRQSPLSPNLFFRSGAPVKTIIDHQTWLGHTSMETLNAWPLPQENKVSWSPEGDIRIESPHKRLKFYARSILIR